jgi:hypothetical protein
LKAQVVEMSVKYRYRVTHIPSGFSTVLDFADSDKVSLAKAGHTPLQNQIRTRFYNAPGHELDSAGWKKIYRAYEEFLWEDIDIGDPEIIHTDEPPTPPAA